MTCLQIINITDENGQLCFSKFWFGDGQHLLLLLLTEVGSARLRESDQHPISPKTPAPQYQPTDRRNGKGKIVEDKKK